MASPSTTYIPVTTISSEEVDSLDDIATSTSATDTRPLLPPKLARKQWRAQLEARREHAAILPAKLARKVRRGATTMAAVETSKELAMDTLPAATATTPLATTQSKKPAKRGAPRPEAVRLTQHLSPMCQLAPETTSTVMPETSNRRLTRSRLNAVKGQVAATKRGAEEVDSSSLDSPRSNTDKENRAAKKRRRR